MSKKLENKGPRPNYVKKPRSLFPDWMSWLPLQQQAVLVIACRGQDGDLKNTGFKIIMWAMRASIMKAAHLGTMLKMGDWAGSFMGLNLFKDAVAWSDHINRTLEQEGDGTNLHYYTHLMHAAAILGFKHPDPEYRLRWLCCYHTMVKFIHLYPETEVQLDGRLADWNRDKWKEEQ